MKEEPKYVLLIHGGVGTILRENMSVEIENAYSNALDESLKAGERILAARGTAIEAVEAAVRVMEDSPLFNAGKGSVFTHEGKNEMDASIMDGATGKAGAVSGVCAVKNPIVVARKVMEQSDHVMLAGQGAEEFARKVHCEMEEPDYFHTQRRLEELALAKENDEVVLDHSGANKTVEQRIEAGRKKFGTVGAVALDLHANIAAATSTGGMTNKRYGRVGDTPIIGAGTYANNDTCAISCTGHGEYFIRNVVAYDVSARMEYKGVGLAEAAEYVINDKLAKQVAEGGLVGVDKKGNYVMAFNTPGMYRGHASSGKERQIEIYK